MSIYGYDQFYVGGSYGLTITGPSRKPNPAQTYIPATQARLVKDIPFAMPNGPGDLVRKYGVKLYEGMLTDPAVASSFLKVKLGAISGGMDLVPTKRPPHYRRKSGEHQLNPDRMREMTPEEKRAQEIKEFCDRLVDRVNDWPSVLIQLLDGLAYGVKLAEFTYVKQKDGLDAGKMVWQTVRVKPDWAWRFVVNRTLDIKGILSWAPEYGYKVWEPDKFEWFTYLPHNGDPRGTSILDSAYKAWNLKTQAMPMYYQHLQRWGSPGLDMELPEGANGFMPQRDQYGVEIPDAPPLTYEAYHAQALAAYANGSVLVRPAGSSLGVMEPKSNGEAFLHAFDYFDRQIVWAIELTTRAAAAGATGKGVVESDENQKSLVVTLIKMLLGITVRSALRKAVAMNFSAADAEQYTPLVKLGDAASHNRAELWNAVANLARAGYIGESQKAELDAIVDLPPRDAQADAEADAANQQQQQLNPDGQPGGRPQPSKPDAGKANNK